METLEYKGYKIFIEQDEYPENPREWCNVGTMVCNHKRYTLGDELLEYHGKSMLDDLKQHLKQKGLKLSDICYLPLYLYEHSGITINTTRFRWDSGQVGWIYATKEQLRREYGVKRITKAFRKKVETVLKREVTTYDQYLTGEVYKFYITDLEGNIINGAGCGGWYGKDDAIAQAKSDIDFEIERV